MLPSIGGTGFDYGRFLTVSQALEELLN